MDSFHAPLSRGSEWGIERMALEIERKFLLANDDWKGEVIKSDRLRDGLIARFGQGQVRVRVTESDAWLTIKGPREAMSRSDNRPVSPLCSPHRRPPIYPSHGETAERTDASRLAHIRSHCRFGPSARARVRRRSRRRRQILRQPGRHDMVGAPLDQHRPVWRPADAAELHPQHFVSWIRRAGLWLRNQLWLYVRPHGRPNRRRPRRA